MSTHPPTRPHSAKPRSEGDLEARVRPDGGWRDRLYNAVGFPRVFYLKYHGYAAYFPLWALARYRNLRNAGETRVRLGI